MTAELHALPTPDKTPERVQVDIEVKHVLDTHSAHDSDIAGFAFMVWDKEGASTVKALRFTGAIPTILIPDFVRNRLLAETSEDWTIETINEQK